MSIDHCRICKCADFAEVISVREMMFGTRKTYQYQKCENCGVLQIGKPEEDSQYLYPSYYYSFSSGNNSIKKKIKKIFTKWLVIKELGSGGLLENLLPLREERKDAASLKGYFTKSSSILDVGCGTGELLMALYDLGYKKIKGIDPFIRSSFAYGQAQIEKKSILEIGGEKFDLIMFHHSFEHMENPLEVVTKIKSLLSSEGVCIIRIPVSDSYSFEHYRENWVQLDAPRHVFLHTNKSMLHLLSSVGLQIELIKDDSGISQFIGSEQYLKNICLTAPNSFYRPFYKNLFGNWVLTSKEISSFKERSVKLNQAGKGDQRIYYIRHQ